MRAPKGIQYGIILTEKIAKNRHLKTLDPRTPDPKLGKPSYRYFPVIVTSCSAFQMPEGEWGSG